MGDEDLADRVAAVVTGVRGVAALHGGMFGEVGTYLPGRRVLGVRIGHESTDVHVSVYYGAPVRQVAAAIQHAVGALQVGPVNVTVEDLVPARS